MTLKGSRCAETNLRILIKNNSLRFAELLTQLGDLYSLRTCDCWKKIVLNELKAIYAL